MNGNKKSCVPACMVCGLPASVTLEDARKGDGHPERLHFCGYGCLASHLSGTCPSLLLADALESVSRFNSEVIGLDAPDTPRVLSGERLEFARGHLVEELNEFIEASALCDVPAAADALVDLVYVALGRLYEMGVHAGHAFRDVHNANMTKVRGRKARAVESDADAVKPEGWKPPDHSWLAYVSKDVVEAIRAAQAGGAHDALLLSVPTHGSYLPPRTATETALAGLAEALSHAAERSAVIRLLTEMGKTYTDERSFGHALATFARLTGAIRLVDAATALLAGIDEHGSLEVVLGGERVTISPVLVEVSLLRSRKAHDYRDSSVASLKDYFPFGLRSHVQMVWTKALRLVNLVSTARRPNNESVVDSLRDIINYAVFAVEDVQGIIEGDPDRVPSRLLRDLASGANGAEAK